MTGTDRKTVAEAAGDR